MQPTSTATSPIRRWRPTPPWRRSKATRRRSGPRRRIRSAPATRLPRAIGFPGGKGPRHHAVCRRRVWRQDQQPRGGRGGAAGQGRRQAGAGDVEPRGGIFLRHLPSGGRREDQFRRGCRRQNGLLGLRRLFRRRTRRAAILHRAESSHRVARVGFWRTGERASVRHRRLARARATTPTPSPANRRLTSWPPARALIRCEFRLNNLERPAHDPRAQGRRRKIRLDARQGAEQARLRRGVRH